MAEWIQCPSCLLRHQARPDGLCPRCRQPATPGWGRAASVPGPPMPAGGPTPGVPVPGAAPGYPLPTYGFPGAFTVGNFYTAVFVAWWRSAAAVVPFTLLAFAPAAIAVHRLYAGFLRHPEAPPDPGSLLAGFLPLLGLLLVVSPLHQVAVVRAGVRAQAGEAVAVGDMLGAAVRFFFPTIGLTFLVGLACLGTACTLYIVPMMLLTAWSASIPAMITEQLGPIEALRRSWALTRGSRWPVFAGFLLVFLTLVAVMCMLQGLLTAVVVGVMAGVAKGDPTRFVGSMSVLQSVNVLLQGVYGSFFSVATAVVYQQLRVAQEGPPASSLGRVFE